MNSIVAYLITRGDAIHSIIWWLLALIFVTIAIMLIAIIIYSKIFDEYTDADEEDSASIRFISKHFFHVIALFLILVTIKSVTPRSQDLAIIAGLKAITAESLDNTLPVTQDVFRHYFPELVQGQTRIEQENSQYKAINNSLNKELEALRDSVQELKTLNNALRISNDRLRESSNNIESNFNN